jgi:hypothetical protein
LEGRDIARETGGSRPSPFPDGAVRTTGAPRPVTLGAENAASAVPPVAAAAALIVETCAMVAVQAARYLLEQALNATGVRRRENGPDELGYGRGQGRGSDPG